MNNKPRKPSEKQPVDKKHQKRRAPGTSAERATGAPAQETNEAEDSPLKTVNGTPIIEKLPEG
jgi:hypothetical protein